MCKFLSNDDLVEGWKIVCCMHMQEQERKAAEKAEANRRMRNELEGVHSFLAYSIEHASHPQSAKAFAKVACVHQCCLHIGRPPWSGAGVRAVTDSEASRQQDLKAELDDMMAASRAPLPGLRHALCV